MSVDLSGPGGHALDRCGRRRSAPAGFTAFATGNLDQIPGISGVQNIIEDRDGGFWVAANEGLFHVRGGKASLYQPNRSLPRRNGGLLPGFDRDSLVCDIRPGVVPFSGRPLQSDYDERRSSQ